MLLPDLLQGPSRPHSGLVAFCILWHMIQGNVLKGGICCSRASRCLLVLHTYILGASLVAQLIKNPPTMQEIPVQFLGQEDPLEKGLATHSSILGLPWWLRQQRICLQYRRPRFDPLVGKIPWRRDWLPTPVFLPGETLVGYSPWGHKESDMTEHTFKFHQTEGNIVIILIKYHICRKIKPQDKNNLQVF